MSCGRPAYGHGRALQAGQDVLLGASGAWLDAQWMVWWMGSPSGSGPARPLGPRLSLLQYAGSPSALVAPGGLSSHLLGHLAPTGSLQVP